MSTLGKWKFFAESSLLHLEHLLIVSLGVMQYHSIAFFDGLSFESTKLEIDFEQLSLIVGGNDHTAFFLGGDGDGDGVDLCDE